MDASKIMNAFGWKARFRFEDGLRTTIRWYRENRSWWEHVISGEYKEYYKVMYEDR
jgi:dTDP-glucose 4,6-dehydratase